MKFRLVFEGDLAPRQRVDLKHVHAIRRQLHPQLKKLWDLPPLESLKERWLQPLVVAENNPYQRIEEVSGQKYAPLIAHHSAAELDILLLRQQAPGQLIGDGGDIDNRLKTLFDALRMPSKSEVQNLAAMVADDESPMHCLLQDDSLIHRVNIETDRLLKQVEPRTLVAIISVKILVTHASLGSMSLMVD